MVPNARLQKRNQAFWEKMADSRTGADNTQHEPGASLVAGRKTGGREGEREGGRGGREEKERKKGRK